MLNIEFKILNVKIRILSPKLNLGEYEYFVNVFLFIIPIGAICNNVRLWFDSLTLKI